ncbi:flavodoxin domain-containing protein [Tissierella carlieri]|uniref:Flavodoxin domain-containing protein n=1 Tax=Tissierella carlieri TaxID=689904 RepID=A0ABT1SDI0_9FIRM|nr:flavodoxin domain-containing protein [Tissierella carlieri]MBU5311152.1 flavodoxin domain-containing protein [Tissierella carlieri]MCQ4924531.1 flavodoxin domain-containing protein [Tissierella carlieri]
MNKIVVVYKSKYGSTKKYAEWIAKELEADLFESSEIKGEKLSEYDSIIFGGGLYASGINGIGIITKNFQDLKSKNLIIFTVGLAATDDKDIFKPIIEKNLTEEMRKEVKIFHLRGGIDYSKLNFLHKSMMAMLKRMVANKKPEELSTEDKMMLETYGEKVDFTNIEAIEPLVSYVKGIN